MFVEKKPVSIEDEYDNKVETGEWETVYSKPELAYGNISPAKGETTTRQFGEELGYDKVIVLADKTLPINEYSVLWVDSTPIIEEDGKTKTPHDYIVKKMAISINSSAVAVKKVNVS